ncbi:hypothetical protein QR680_006664 [Steinernema hermaphroditum]|uniref:Uncharacterized protein n=1 Tax=Steinernema hermaphroditum TaxID=289476 RepID=A0AA39LXH3_9BILA|nr:hypothetical protein QR680_006664 [Steinernema hermaphroditum]
MTNCGYVWKSINTSANQLNHLWLHKPSQTQVATQAFLNGYTSLLNGYTSLLNPLATTQVYYAKKKFPPKRNNQPHEVAKH